MNAGEGTRKNRIQTIPPVGLPVVAVALILIGCDGVGLRNRSDAISSSGNTQENTSSTSRTGSRSERVAELLASSLRPGSNFTRGPTTSVLIRLQALFGSTAVPHYFFDPALTTVTSGVAIGKALGAADSYDSTYQDTRATSTLALAGLRARLTFSASSSSQNLCYGVRSSHALFSTTSVLMDGESVPSDATTALAWAAARNAWLYPYAADSDEVATLKTLFTLSEATGAGNGYQDLCTAVLLAPQFWIGNIGPYDVVRKITLELGGQIPSFRNHFGPFIAGTKTASDLVEEMQAATQTQTDSALSYALQYNNGCFSRGTLAASCSYSPYLDLVKSWHRDWLGLKDFYRSSEFDPMEQFPEQGAQFGSTGTGGQNFYLAYYGTTHGSDSRTALLANQFVLHPEVSSMVRLDSHAYVHDAEYCDASSSSGSITETFNPNTTRVLYEYTPDGGTTWTPLSEWERQASGFTPCTGSTSATYGETYDAFTDTEGYCWLERTTASSVTSAPGSALLKLSQIGVPQRNSSGSTLSDSGTNYAYPFHFPKMGSPASGTYPTLSGLSLQMSVFNTGRRDFRTRRFATDTATSIESEQKGFSKVKLWWNNREVYVCNNLSRILATCSYRPDSTGLPLTWDMNSDSRCQALDGSYSSFSTTISGEETCSSSYHGQKILSLRNLIKGQVNRVLVANPRVLTAFSCGVHDPSATTEFTRYPKSSPFPDTAFNARLDRVPLTTAASNRALSPTRNDLGRIIEGEIDSVHADLANEPFHLLESILSSGGDYRELLTANYTFARGPYELFLRTGGGLPLPIRPSGFARTSANWMSLEKIFPLTFSALADASVTHSDGIAPSSLGVFSPTSYFNGKHLFQDPYTYRSAWNFIETSLNQAGGKPTSGILTQAAFLGPVGGKIRSVANRIFTKLTCKEINYPAVSTSDATHLSFIPTGEMTTGAHLDPTSSCVGCHINLDPLASALSSGFHEKGQDYTVGSNTYTLSSSHVETSSYYSARGETLSLLASGGESLYHETYGTRGIRGNAASSSASQGALFGESVQGVRQVGETLANSDLFARCAVQKTFEGLFGRIPDESADQQLIDRVAEKFQGEFNYNYNLMVRELASSTEFAERK